MENKKTNDSPKMMRGNRAPYQKAKDTKGSLIKLIKFLSPFYVFIMISIILAIAGTIFNLIGPHITKQLSSIIVEYTFVGLKIPLAKVADFGYKLVVLYLTAFFCSGLQGWIMSGVSARVSKKFRSEISIKINKLPLRYFDSTNHGEILSRITNDVDTIWLTLNQSMSQVITSSAMLIGSLIMMFKTNFFMTVTAIVASVIGFLPSSFGPIFDMI
jgi:ATP-binding cassette subfamily B protein